MKKITILNVIVLLSSLGLAACGGGGGGGTPASTSGTTTTPVTTTPPTVVSITPVNGATGVLTNTTLSVTFNVDMDAATITNSNFTLAGANPVSGKISYNTATRTATFTPDAPLKPGTDFTASLTTSITDSAGNALTTVFQGNFTTETFIRRVSVDSTGAEADDSSFAPNTSADGRYVVFQSNATNLIGANNDTNNYTDIFLHDTQTGKTTRVSESTAGVQGDDKSTEPAISADGRYVVFQSDATNLIGAGNDTNKRTDIFLHDTQTGKITRVSESTAGTPTDLSSSNPSISADGRYIAFTSSATNLVTGDTNGVSDIFVRDTLSKPNTTIRVSVSNSGNEVNGDSFEPHISANGRYVVFKSAATNLIGAGNDNNASIDIFVYDMQAVTNVTHRVSVPNSGTQESNSNSFASSISADGRYIAFTSAATNLVTGDTKGMPDIFVRDTLSKPNTTIRVSVSNSGNEVNGDSFEPHISADGRYVAFQSNATNLISADGNYATDVFVRDTQANTTIRVNVDKNGTEANSLGFGGGSANIAISADGRYVVFSSDSDNLATGGDGNTSSDIFRVLNTTP